MNESVDTYISELVPKRERGRTFAIQQAVGLVAVPVLTLLAWIFVPFTPLGLPGWRWVVLFDSLGAFRSAGTAALARVAGPHRRGRSDHERD